MDPATKRHQALMLGHGFLVMMVGMFSGFMLAFALLEAIEIWPLPAIDIRVPGSTRGWAAAHTGSILNGLMVVAVGLALPVLRLGERARAWVAWGLIVTVWGNTAFYIFANFAANRGLSMGANRFGPGDAAGIAAFFPALLGAYLVLIALGLAARAAFQITRAP
jgi:styrene-oxide isomerase